MQEHNKNGDNGKADPESALKRGRCSSWDRLMIKNRVDEEDIVVVVRVCKYEIKASLGSCVSRNIGSQNDNGGFGILAFRLCSRIHLCATSGEYGVVKRKETQGGERRYNGDSNNYTEKEGRKTECIEMTHPKEPFEVDPARAKSSVEMVEGVFNSIVLCDEIYDPNWQVIMFRRSNLHRMIMFNHGPQQERASDTNEGENQVRISISRGRQQTTIKVVKGEKAGREKAKDSKEKI